ncbi:hypothetical protein JIN85_10985 [Luteolibacter pohnpeiensis]|uniref:Uncharacterized protein n=1 Tax=Luteolibacter pohnpeiensis TaxID=454153 RepID=A0A934S826_9BACT|nr:hypothetical protein [Luteolibacter pohnpeiensis]MBK1882944.1 hypothetical protein [Luteolibacter pohnpeiensis]
MSSREKKLLIYFAAAGFIVLNFIGFNFLSSKKMEVQKARNQAVSELDKAEMFRSNSAQVSEEMEWLAQHEPEPKPYQEVQTALQQLVDREINATGLTLKPASEKFLPANDSGTHYHRAQIQVSVTGTNEALIRWFDRMNIPEAFRAATQIRVSPNREDDTKIDCTAIVEQWFVPPPSY